MLEYLLSFEVWFHCKRKLALLRHPDYCMSSYSSVDVKRSIEEGDKQFNQLFAFTFTKSIHDCFKQFNSGKSSQWSIREYLYCFWPIELPLICCVFDIHHFLLICFLPSSCFQLDHSHG